MMRTGQSGDGRPIFLTLFIAPDSHLCRLATSHINAILEHYGGKFELEVVDIFHDPQRLLRERVLVTPTLLASELGQRVVGDLGDASLLDYFLQSLITLQLRPARPNT